MTDLPKRIEDRLEEMLFKLTNEKEALLTELARVKKERDELRKELSNERQFGLLDNH
ncbi:MAG: hypothetical protein GF388_01780 [Candidatus Aegiribacteria sp.]|nr:hypothetical protein [Candidatus Aegiribacteria sp.]